MKTKILLILLILALAFSGCFAEKIPEDAIYDRNLTEHWINGEDGEKLNLGEHELGEYKPGDMVTCSVCQSTYTEQIQQLQYHNWNNGAVTKESTCSENGTMA